MPRFEIWCKAGAVTSGAGSRYSAKVTERFWRDTDADGKPFLDRFTAEREAVRLEQKHGMQFSVRRAK